MVRGYKVSRLEAGLTLVEMLVVTTILSFISAAAFGIMTATMQQGHVMSNKLDTIDITRNAVEKFGREVRMGRCVGDVYGDLSGGVVEGSSTFPGSNNPLYANGAAPPLGWPAWADGSVPSSFTCSNQTFVLQIPIFSNDGRFCTNVGNPAPEFGFPVRIPSNYLAPGVTHAANPTPQEDQATFIYRVVQSPNQPAGGPTEYLMQYLIIPGYDPGTALPGPASAQFGPVTLVNHIIGPLNPQTNLPRTFQYRDRLGNGIPEDAPTCNGAQPQGQLSAQYSGVIMDLEINSNLYSNLATNRKPIAIRTEVYLRNNAQATPVGGAT